MNQSSSTILWESRSVRKLRSFRTLRWKSSKQKPDSATETYWYVLTNFRLHSFLEFWKLKNFLEEIPVELQMLLYDSPGVLKDDLYLSLLRAKSLNVSKDILLKRYVTLQILLGKRPWSRNLLKQLEGTLSYEIRLVTKPTRKGKRYSGYVKTPSAVGSKRGLGNSKPEPGTFEWNTEFVPDYFEYLTVGRLSSASGNISILS